MRVRLVQITTRRSGAKARKEQLREVQSLSVGRGTDNDVVLNELTIALQHATFEKRGGQIHVVRETAPELLVNGQLTEGERLEAGDVVKVGHYELRVIPPEGDEDLALEIEQVVRPGDERAELRKRTQQGVEHGLFRRRPLAWALLLLVLGVFLLGPFASDRIHSVWNSGTISRKHAFIADDCERCHASFEQVPNQGCLECHADAANHTSVEASPTALNQVRCAGCHIEHDGLSGLAQIENARCAACHGKLSDVYADTRFGNSSDFHDEHPEFRFTLVTNPGSGDPELLEWSPELKEKPGVAFNHFLHVGQLEATSDGDHENLRCDDCHAAAEGGRNMKQVTFETHCQDCHSLSFDPNLDTEAPHGDPVELREKLRGLYTERALRGQATGPEEPAAIRALRPGQQLSDAETRMVLDWVKRKVEKANQRAMASCGDCHDLELGGAEDGGTRVVPAELLQTRMPRSNFRHYTHRPFPCASCHPAAAAYEPDDSVERPSWSLPGAGTFALLLPDELPEGIEPSEESTDVMLPSIEACRACHGGARSSPPLVASACVLCHPFHQDKHGSMAKRMAAAKQAE